MSTVYLETLSNELPENVNVQQLEKVFYNTDSDVFRVLSDEVVFLWNVGSTDTNEFLIWNITNSCNNLDIDIKDSFLIEEILPLNVTGSGIASKIHIRVVKACRSKNVKYVGFYWYETSCYSNADTIEEEIRRIFRNAKLIDQFPDNLAELVKELSGMILKGV